MDDPTLGRLALGPRQQTSPRAWRHDVRSAADRRHVVLQTPWVCLACAPRRIARPAFAAHLLLCDLWRESQDSAQREWLRYLRHVRIALHAWVRRCDGCASWSWHDTLQRTDVCASWQLFCRNLDRLRIFDAECQPSTSAALRAESYVRFVVQLEHVWFNAASARAGAHFRILQAQHSALEPPSECAFAAVARLPSAPPAVAETTTAGGCATAAGSARTEHATFGKYFRMLEVGIPRMCVEQKMRMQSLDPHVLDTPPGLPLPVGAETLGARRDGLFTEMTAARTLRKVTTDDTAQRKSAKHNQGNGHGISLHAIRERLRSLRRVARWRKRSDGSHGESHSELRDEATTPERATAAVPSGTHTLFTLLETKYANTRA